MCRKVTAQPARDGAVKTEREMLENLAGFLWSLALFPPIDFLYIKRYNKALTEHTALVENLQREGGETMALEAVKLVAQAEQQSKDRKAEAVLEAKKRLADAEKAGQEALATTKKQADAKGKELLAQAEKDAAEDAARKGRFRAGACPARCFRRRGERGRRRRFAGLFPAAAQ